MKVDDLKEQLMKENPGLLPFLAKLLAKSWIQNPDMKEEIMKEDIKNERKGRKKEKPEVPLVYDTITVNTQIKKVPSPPHMTLTYEEEVYSIENSENLTDIVNAIQEQEARNTTCSENYV
jgi:hypothetical protein